MAPSTHLAKTSSGFTSLKSKLPDSLLCRSFSSHRNSQKKKLESNIVTSNSSDSAKVSMALFSAEKLDAVENSNSKRSLCQHGSSGAGLTGEPLSFEETASACMPATAAISTEPATSNNTGPSTSQGTRVLAYCSCHYASNSAEAANNAASTLIVHEEVIDPIAEEDDDDDNNVDISDETDAGNKKNDKLKNAESTMPTKSQTKERQDIFCNCKHQQPQPTYSPRILATSRSFNDKCYTSLTQEKPDSSSPSDSKVKKKKSASSRLKSTGSLIGRKLLLTKGSPAASTTDDAVSKATTDDATTAATMTESTATTTSATTAGATNIEDNAKTKFDNITASMLRTTTL